MNNFFKNSPFCTEGSRPSVRRTNVVSTDLYRRSCRKGYVRGESPWCGSSSVGSWTDVCTRRWPAWRLWPRPPRRPGVHAPDAAACAAEWRAHRGPGTSWWSSSPWSSWTPSCSVHLLVRFPCFPKKNSIQLKLIHLNEEIQLKSRGRKMAQWVGESAIAPLPLRSSPRETKPFNLN